MLSKYSKGVVSLLVFAFAAIALFAGGSIFGFHVTGSFQAKVISLVPLGAGVVAVVGTKNTTEDAIDKAIMQFVLGAISVAQFFTQIPSDLGVKIGAFIYAAVAAYFVWRKSNTPEPAPAAVASVSPTVPPIRR
jgi:hypothetical protein